MKPTIVIERATPVYERNLAKVRDYEMPDDAVYEAKIAQMGELWDAWGQKILDKLADVTRLQWPVNHITCYVVSGTFASFSHPLTLKIYDDSEQMFDTLVHELMHVLLKGTPGLHPEEHRAARKRLMAAYESESLTTKNHIILQALHAELALALWGRERAERIMARDKKPDYVRSWEIVKERGRAEILREVFTYNPQ